MEVFNLILIALLVLSLAILNFTYLSLRYIKEGLRTINKKTWVLLLLIFLAGFFLRFFVTTHMHNLYYDEDGYMDIAKHIANNGNNCLCLKNTVGVCDICGYSFKSVGFSFLLALIFKAFGASHSSAFNFVVVIGSLTVLTMFLLLYLLFEDEKTALLGALIIAFYPLHVRWSGSASSEVVSLFFITLTFSCLLLYRKVNKIVLLVLSLLLFAYTIMVKEENILLIIFLGVFFLAKKKYRKILLCVLFIVLIVLVPYLFGNYLFHTDVSEQTSLSRYTFWKHGGILSFEFFKKDFPTNMSFLVNWDYTMHMVLLLNFVGMFYMFKNKKALGIILLIWLLTIVSLFSSYIGMPLIQSEVRHYLQVLIVIVAFSSYGAASLLKHKTLKRFRIETLIVVAILASTFLYLHYLDSKESPVLSVQNDHDLVEKSLSLLPKDCIVITQESYLFDFFDQSATSIYILPSEKLDQKCYYYYEGEVCWRQEANNLCKEFRKKTVLSEPLLSDGKHSLYRLSQLVD
jgi:4-amino-4-deoxy-L-arabinose transferase-like glycosyltransferase